MKLFSPVRSETLALSKKNGFTLLLLGLVGRLVGIIGKWYYNKIGISDSIKLLNLQKNNGLASLRTDISNGIEVGTDEVFTLYTQARETIQPHLFEVGIIRLIATIASLLIFMSLAQLVLNKGDTGKIHFKENLKIFLPFAGTILLQKILTVALTLLFVIPGIIAGVYWMFTNLIALDKKIYFWSAMKESYKTIKNRWRTSLGYTILFGLSGGLVILLITTVFGNILENFGTEVNVGITTLVAVLLGLIMEILIIVFYKRWKLD